MRDPGSELRQLIGEREKTRAKIINGMKKKVNTAVVVHTAVGVGWTEETPKIYIIGITVVHRRGMDGRN